ncbi:MAG TPA: PQQ-binding-like beta-propeller repeat protein [Gemmataceae bacterium]|jgi:outer membrane protein assembly factor BamB|nr:PQQ-binding-like beta-propeller repeat protein [Gemmataceae bacterium]
MQIRCLGLLAALSLAVCACAEPKKPGSPTSTGGSFDWPQWRGPERNEVNKETGLLKDWPKEGPPLAWEMKDLGGGFSTPSVAGGRIFGMSDRGKDEVVWALDEANGKELWATRISNSSGNGGTDGPRSTPTVEGDLLWTLGFHGDLVCLDVKSGEIKWQKNLRKEFKGQVGGWQYSESPLIDGDKLIATPGGSEAALVALNKKTGEVIWKAKVPGVERAEYSSVIVAEIGGKRQYIQFMGGGVVAVAADDGRFLWRYDSPHNTTANCSTPIYSDGHVFAASGYGTGGGLAKINFSNGEFTAEEVYFTKKMVNHHGGMVLVDGYLYGSNEGLLTCLDFHSGKLMWDDRAPGKGSITYADGRLYYRNEGGPICLVEATPTKYIEHGRFNQPDRSNRSAWPHPVIANGKLYIRDQDVLLCYDVKEKK